jgi:hypothetical protein
MTEERYTGTYNRFNHNGTDNTIDCTRTIYDVMLGYTNTFNKLLELVQKYYNEVIKNYFNFISNSEKSYNL